MRARKSIFEIIGTDEKFSILLKFLQDAGGGGMLGRVTKPFTFLAPTDGAFYRVSQQWPADGPPASDRILMQSVLCRHLIPGLRLYSDDFRRRPSVVNFEDEVLPVRADENRIFIAGAQILTPAIEARDGVLFAVDRVLLPPAES